MKLAELMRPWITENIPDCEILGVHNDSRQIKHGFYFLLILVLLLMADYIFNKRLMLAQKRSFMSRIIGQKIVNFRHNCHASPYLIWQKNLLQLPADFLMNQQKN